VAGYGFKGISKVRASDGTPLQDIRVDGFPEYLAFDGSAIWVTLSYNQTVERFRTRDGALLATIPVGALPKGITFDGSSIWVTNYLDNTVTKIGR
jgi:DNA-binding beta-propeller fold protein YncE